MSGGTNDLIDRLDQLEKQKVSKGTIELELKTYLDYRARQRGIPLCGTFELTPLCNLDCKMCYVHLNQEQMAVGQRNMLSGDKWKQIMQEAIDHGLMYALLTGGEAMLHPDFDELFMFLRDQGVQVTVTTNGLLLSEERIAFFSKHLPAEIRVTLYGSDEFSYEKVTGHRVYERVVSNIRKAKDAGIPMSIGITPSRYLQDDVYEVVKLAKSLDIKYGINSSLSDPRQETGRNGVFHDMSLDKYIQLYKRLQRLDGFVPTPVCDADVPKARGYTSEVHKGFRCGGGRSSFAVVWYGCLQPCLSVDEFQADLTDMSFSEGWRHVFGFTSDYPVPAECYGCPYEGFCTVCVAKHAEGAPKGHANPMLCERARRFAKEGLTKTNR